MTPPDSDRYGRVDADAHQTTLDLLKEVADYLDRLPKHPMTHSVLQKVRSHLDNPSAKAQEGRLAMLSKDQIMSAKVKSGNGFKGASQYTPTGLPIVSARLLYPTLQLESPAVQELLDAGELLKAERLSAAIGRDIASGMSIHFSSIHPNLDHD